MTKKEEYSIGTLAEMAEVTTRTIRYYVAEGLLSAPEGSGRAASYTQEHLARLRFIKILKDEFLPLQEIGMLLASLDYQAVVDLLEEKRKSEPPPTPTPNSAKEYLQTLLHPSPDSEQSKTLMRHKVQAHQTDPDKKRDSSLLFRRGISEAHLKENSEEGLKETVRPTNPPATTHWQRIEITPDVELHIRGGGDQPDFWSKINQFIKIARQILSSIIILS
jgi:DNA-binding transcriptional MerR regulator